MCWPGGSLRNQTCLICEDHSTQRSQRGSVSTSEHLELTSWGSALGGFPRFAVSQLIGEKFPMASNRVGEALFEVGEPSTTTTSRLRVPRPMTR